jgi:hypothetical protein
MARRGEIGEGGEGDACAAVRGGGAATRWFGGVAAAVTQYGGLACQRADKAEDERGGPCREEGGTGAEEHEGAYARCAQPLQGEQAWLGLGFKGWVRVRVLGFG